jgi:hypothetical protein
MTAHAYAPPVRHVVSKAMTCSSTDKESSRVPSLSRESASSPGNRRASLPMRKVQPPIAGLTHSPGVSLVTAVSYANALSYSSVPIRSR